VIVDTSALIAVLAGEPDAEAMLEAMAAADILAISAASYLEAGIVIDSLGDPVKSRRLDELLTALEIDVVDVSVEQAVIARAAFRDFGKGSGHPAGLNFGDLFAYALAKDTATPLLYKGDDFGHTDVRRGLG
jgi:ribonuclease VapC